MPEAIKNTAIADPQPSGQEVPQFAEEKRLPLTNAARDAFLQALAEDRQPTPAALAAAERYKQAQLDEPGRAE